MSGICSHSENIRNLYACVGLFYLKPSKVHLFCQSCLISLLKTIYYYPLALEADLMLDMVHTNLQRDQ